MLFVRVASQRGWLDALARERPHGVDIAAEAERLREQSEKAEGGKGQGKLFRHYKDFQSTAELPSGATRRGAFAL